MRCTIKLCLQVLLYTTIITFCSFTFRHHAEHSVSENNVYGSKTEMTDKFPESSFRRLSDGFAKSSSNSTRQGDLAHIISLETDYPMTNMLGGSDPNKVLDIIDNTNKNRTNTKNIEFIVTADNYTTKLMSIQQSIPDSHLRSALSFEYWCRKVQLKNCSFVPYMDKHTMKQLLPEMAPGLDYAKLYGYVRSADEITDDFLDKLPENYVMKASHWSGAIIGVRGGKITCFKSNKCHKSMSIMQTWPLAHCLRHICDYYLQRTYKIGREKCYQFIPKKCIFEEEFEVTETTKVVDYKVFTFSGQPMFMKIYTHYDNGMHINFRTPSWIEITRAKMSSGTINIGPVHYPKEPPPFLSELLRYAALIGRHFIHARVDFFVFGNEFKFAEVTQTHNGCKFKIQPTVVDRFYGYLATHPGVTVDPDYILYLSEHKRDLF